ncbi:hypothetical protein [Deinococcus xinjiangensis]
MKSKNTSHTLITKTLPKILAAPSFQVFTYTKCGHAESHHEFFGQLADVLSDMPQGLRLRAVLKAHPASQQCWLIVQGGDIGELASVLNLTPASADAFGADLDQAAQGTNVVRVREGAMVTEPGMTQGLSRWLVERGHIAYMVCDFVPQSGGLAAVELTYIFNGDRAASRQFGKQVCEVMYAETSTYSPAKAAKFLTRLKHHLWGRPRMVVTVGNAADLWPTVF